MMNKNLKEKCARIENFVTGKNSIVARRFFWNLSKFPKNYLPFFDLDLKEFETEKDFFDFLARIKANYIAKNPAYNEIFIPESCEEYIRMLSVVIDRETAIIAYEACRDAIFYNTKSVQDAIKFNNPEASLRACFSNENAITMLTPYQKDFYQLLKILFKTYLNNTRPINYILKCK